MNNKRLFKLSADFIYEYVAYIHTYIKVNKTTNSLVDRADYEFDMYEILFIEALNKALKTDGGTTVFDKKTVSDVADGIKHILKNQKSYGKVLMQREMFILICTKVFQKLVLETRSQHNITGKVIEKDE